MTKRETRKAAYRLIVKEKKTHQEVFDELREKTEMDISALAKMVGGIPSPAKRQKNKTLISVYIVLLGLTIITRILGAFGLSMMGEMNGPILLLILVLGLVVPGIAIYGAVVSKVEIYYSTAGLLAYNLFRTFTKDVELLGDPLSWVSLIPMILVIIFAILIPFQLKTSYKERQVVEETDGRKSSRLVVEFEEQENRLNPDILDA